MDSNEVALAFGRALRKLRLDAGMTQEQLGFEADLQRKYVSELEHGLKQPSVTTLFKVARALGTKPSKFAGLIAAELGEK